MAGRHGYHGGGIFWLLDLIEEHRAELEYDWRTRFRLSLAELGHSMGWGEGVRLLRLLLRDPSSWIMAALSKWEYPLSRGEITLIELYDLTHMAHSDGKKKPKPYPRPWKIKTDTKVAKPTVSQDRVLAALRRAGHTMPVPTAD